MRLRSATAIFRTIARHICASDSLQPAGPRQAAAAAACVDGGRSLRRERPPLPAAVCRGDGSHLFADPRRPAGDGRRRPASRPADLPQGVRRGDGDPGRRRPADAGLRSARHAMCSPPAVAARCCAVPGEAAGARDLVGGQADDLAGRFRRAIWNAWKRFIAARPAPCFWSRCELGGIVAGADDGSAGGARRFGASSGWRFRSSTTCSTCAATKRRWANESARIRTAAN